ISVPKVLDFTEPTDFPNRRGREGCRDLQKVSLFSACSAFSAVQRSSLSWRIPILARRSEVFAHHANLKRANRENRNIRGRIIATSASIPKSPSLFCHQFVCLFRCGRVHPRLIFVVPKAALEDYLVGTNASARLAGGARTNISH